MKVGSECDPIGELWRLLTQCRTKKQASASPAEAQNRKAIGGQAEEAEKAWKEGASDFCVFCISDGHLVYSGPHIAFLLTARKDPTWRSKLKKDPGIPNLFPYKERILQEIEEKKRLREEENARIKEEARARRQKKGDEDEAVENGSDMEDDFEEYDEEGDDAMEDV
jgi:hypothetical protein